MAIECFAAGAAAVALGKFVLNAVSDVVSSSSSSSRDDEEDHRYRGAYGCSKTSEEIDSDNKLDTY